MGTQDNAIDNPSLGIAKRIGTETSTFDLPVHKLLQAVIKHSPSRETVAQEFLVELAKCEIEAVRNPGDVLLYLRPQAS